MDFSGKTDSKINTTLLQFGFGAARELLAYSTVTFKKFCEVHNINYCLDNTPLHNPKRTPHWQKIHLINKWFRSANDNDILIYCDCDVLAKRFNVSPHNVLEVDQDIAMVKTVKGNWNNGVMFIRANNRTFRFFEFVEQAGPMAKYGTRWNDEARMCYEIPFFTEKEKLNVGLLDAKWNDAEIMEIRSENPVFSAWHGLPKDTVLKRMKEIFFHDKLVPELI